LGMTLMWPTCSTLRSPCALFDSSLIFFIIALPLGSSFAPGLIGWVLFDVAMTISLLGGILGRCCSGTTRRSEFKVMPAKSNSSKLSHRGRRRASILRHYVATTDVTGPTKPYIPVQGISAHRTNNQQAFWRSLVKPHRDLKSTARRAAGTLWPSDWETYFFCLLLRAAGFPNARSSILLSLLYS